MDVLSVASITQKTVNIILLDIIRFLVVFPIFIQLMDFTSDIPLLLQIEALQEHRKVNHPVVFSIKGDNRTTRCPDKTENTIGSRQTAWKWFSYLVNFAETSFTQ